MKAISRRKTRILALILAMAAVGRASASDVEPLTIPNASLPHLAVTTDDSVVLSWVESNSDTSRLRYARFRAGTWNSPTTVAEGDDWFVNWADFPSVVPITDSLWAAHWLRKRAGGTYAYDVMVSTSQDDGQSWSVPFSPHDDGTPTEHGFVSLFSIDNRLAAVWLDGRNTGGGHTDHDHHAQNGAMTVRAASFDIDHTRIMDSVIDARTCDCCQTDVAITSSGPLAVYRDRSDENVRDISISRYTDESWSEPKTVANDDWIINGCPVNGPSIAASEDSVTVAWYTAPDKQPAIRAALSHDGGESFPTVVELPSDRPLGRVATAHLDDARRAIIWLDQTGAATADIQLAIIDAEGSVQHQTVVASTVPTRRSGFPQLIAHAQSLVLAWTDVHRGDLRVRVKSIPLPPEA
ncbi:MAG: sialidase family protein [Pseudomonadota bacterium]